MGMPPLRAHTQSVLEPTASFIQRAKLNSTNGPITIGESCLISERSLIQAADSNGIVLGDAVLVECNAILEGKEIGEGTDVEVGAKIGKGAVVGKVREKLW